MVIWKIGPSTSFRRTKIMLIFLDDDITHELNDNNIIAIQNIAECIRSGRHIIIANRSLLKSLYMLETISPVNQRIFKHLYNHITQYGMIRDRIKTYVHISSAINNVEKAITDKHIIYKMPLHIFSDSKNLQETKLICEDLMDCEFYQGLAKYYMRQKHLSGSIGFEKINGGGLNTGKNYEDKLSATYTPCLAIVDSDKTSPDGLLGETAKYVNNVYSKYNDNHVTYTHILQVREKENLIPPEVYYNLELNQDIKKQHEILLRMYNSDYKNSYLYGDIKRGFNRNTDRDMVRDFILCEVKKMIKKDCTIEDLRNQTKPLRRFLGDNILCSVVDDLYTESTEERKNIICGVKKTFSYFKKQILEEELEKTILSKKELAEVHNSATLKNEIFNLEDSLIKINNIVNTSLKNEFEEYWKEIALMCYDWGCKFHVHIA